MPVDAVGVLELRKALKKLAPDMAKESQREIAGLLRSISNKAKGFVPSEAPLSGWASHKGIWGEGARRYDAGEIKRGITFSAAPSKPNKQGFRALAAIYNKSAAGAIYETAGRKSGADGRPWAPSVQHYANAGTPFAKADYMIRNSDKAYSQSGNPNAGKQFIAAMGPIYKATRKEGQTGRVSRKMNGRLIFRAWGEDNGKVNAKIMKAIEGSLDKVVTATRKAA
jgi:hypothetical protein